MKSTVIGFPDTNVWLALATHEHVHASLAKQWWGQQEGPIAFSRLTQLGFLRLTTTAAAMDGKPLTVAQAWRVYDRFYDDDRVLFVAEPPEIDQRFREKSNWSSGFTENLGRCLAACHSAGCWRHTHHIR